MGAEPEGRPPGAGDCGRQGERVLAELIDALRLARLAPGQRLSMRELAAAGRGSEADVAEILPRLAGTGLVAVEGPAITVRPLDPNAMFATLPRRRELETVIARAAAVRATDAQLRMMKASEALQSRCAKVGDMDGLMTAERELERLLIEGSGLTAEGEELIGIKHEYRRAWCAANRLRSFTNVANIRTALVAAVAARDPDAAEAQVQVFFDHLLRTY